MCLACREEMMVHVAASRSPHPRRIILIIATKDKCTRPLFLRGALKHNAGRMSECPQHPRSIFHNRGCKGSCVVWILSADLGANNATKLGT
ncbi:hypothetical protein AB1N83_011614 [Pleurotus pulmonarius]